MTEFGIEIGVTDRQVRHYLDGKSVPPDISKIEEKLFGRDPTYKVEQRRQLRKAHEAAVERKEKPRPPQVPRTVEHAKPAFALNIPITPRLSVVVLPFANIGGGPQQEHFAIHTMPGLPDLLGEQYGHCIKI